ncbi:: HTH_17 [Gemmataceae bacterium]|nr:: HTH_17 [Gemmataceae bacterium]VTT99017.1 : HTH_17 [Gemmataceae bacterium]
MANPVVSSHRGLVVEEVARRLRVSPDKVRLWIRRGELAAVNTADTVCGKPRFVVTPESLAEFERLRSAAAPQPKVVRRRRTTTTIDFFPG